MLAYAQAASRSPSADAGAELLGAADREAAAEPREHGRRPVERPTRIRSSVRSSSSISSASVAGTRRAASSSDRSRSTSTSQRHGVRASDVET